jgi:hypothetical protein
MTETRKRAGRGGSAPAPAGPRVALLLRLLDQAFDRKGWHGPTLGGALRGLGAEEAAWRPAPGRHNVWELAVHCAYWKYTVLRRITGERRGSVALAGSNWFPRPEEPSEAAWKADLALLATTHRALRAEVAAVPEARLDRVPPGSKTLLSDLVQGIAAHDLYHAGQIQLLKRLRTADGGA